MVRAFLEADKQRQVRKNQDAWLQGAYFLKALDAVVGNAFRKKGDKPAEYPQEPIELKLDEKRTAEKDKDAEEREAVFAKAYMMSMVRAGREWGKK